jgi:putative toxin-antitoxin system antitoxin component (TIGR02293 family)
MAAYSSLSVEAQKEALYILIHRFLNEQDTAGQLQEVAAVYHSPVLFTDVIQLSKALDAGMPHALFAQIQALTPFTEAEWADILELSGKSLQRYRDTPAFRFKRTHSEKIFGLAEVSYLALDFFGSNDAYTVWLHAPCFALGSQMPIHLLKDSYGKSLVLAELHRMNHGIFV